MRNLVSICVFLLLLAPCAARTITVDDDGPADFNNIQAAINDASAGDIVEVKPGTYTGPGNRDIDFLGKAITVRSTDPTDPNIVAATIIDCNGTQLDPHRAFTFHSHEGRASILSGLTITGGYAPFFTSYSSSGPFWFCPSTTTIKHSGGGAIWIKDSSPTIVSCTIRGNRAGSAYVPEPDATQHPGYGGGIFCGSDSSAIIINCTLKGNSSSLFGGAIYSGGVRSSPSVINSTIVGNDAASGGGIWCGVGSPRIVSCEIIGNRAAYSGFDIPVWFMTDDRYSGRGGGVCCCEADATIHSCLFVGNRAPRGGALSCSDGTAEITNCTITGNVATYGGALCCYYDGSAALENCILWNNSAEVGDEVTMLTYSFYCDGNGCWPPGYWNHPSSCVASYSDIHGGPESVAVESLSSFDWGAGNIDAKPIFQEQGYWADVCDPNTVVEPNDPNAVWIDGSYRLVGGSPCLDAGDNNSVPPDTDDLDNDGDTAEAIPFDCDGDPRFLDDPCTPDTGNPSPFGPPVVDMGAYEGVHQGFVLSTEALTVWEASTATFTVALLLDPHGTVEVTVARESGDTDITVLSGGILTFDSSNYSKPQTVTLAAAHDDDNLSGNALILITAPGFYSRTVSATEGETLYVDANAVGANNGTSWPDAFICLQDAFAVASDYPGVYEVRVAEGIYKPDIGGGQTLGDRQAAFHLISGVTIYGGFPSGGGGWEARDPNLHETILSGDLEGNDVDVDDPWDLLTEPTRAENSYHVVTGHNAGPGAVLNGFIITAGNANGSSQDREDCGGGLYNNPGSPKVINCTFSNNSASSYGGGMSNWNESDPMVTSCIFSGNTASLFGGGMYNNYYSNPMVTNCTFSSNAASGWGGGMQNHWWSNPTVINCSFVGNSAYYGGGGMSNAPYNNLTVINCTFSGNAAGNGGGMNNGRGNNSTITNCTFSSNSATWGGGGIYSDECSPTVSNCTFKENSASQGGGGMKNGWFSSTMVTNCTFSGNVASDYGGGMANYRCSPTVTNCTFSGNAAGLGGGMYNYQYSVIALRNCILWGNSPSNEAQIYNDATSSSTVTYSDVQDDGSGPGNIDADPCFIEPGYWADANDPNCHVEPNHPNALWIDGDHRLLPWSPCIDAGDNNSLPADTADLDGDGNTSEPIPWDLDGNPRTVDGNSDGHSVVDMGAYEFFWPPIEVSMKLTPQTLNPGSQGRWVKAHFVLPEGFTVEDVDTSTPAKITEPFEPDIESEYMNVFANEDGLVEVEAAFERAEFCSGVVDGNTVQVTGVGLLTSGQQFYGTDTVKITNNALSHLADLASYWLEGNCDQPDWCGGLDLDLDGTLDFVDFAMFESCCVEAVGDE